MVKNINEDALTFAVDNVPVVGRVVVVTGSVSGHIAQWRVDVHASQSLVRSKVHHSLPRKLFM